MSWGDIVCVHIDKAEVHEESEQGLDCWKVTEIVSKDWDVFKTYFTLKQNQWFVEDGSCVTTALRVKGEQQPLHCMETGRCKCCRCRTPLQVPTWGHPPHGQMLPLPKPGHLFWVQQTAHYQVRVWKDTLTCLGRSKNSLSTWCQG